MTTRVGTVNVETTRVKIEERPMGGLTFDWAVVGFSAWFLGGLYLDGWAHNHVAQLETFFTPWHAVFYSGYFAVAGFLAFSMWRHHNKGHLWTRSLPEGYQLTMLGVPIFFLGGIGDMIWHIVFGIERNLEALFSPTHLILATGIALIVSGPLRAAWHRSPSKGWSGLLPMLLSLTFLLSLLTFMTQFAHPVAEPWIAQKISKAQIHSAIYTMNASGAAQTRLTHLPESEETSPVLSPDGSKIAFASNRDGNIEVYLINADGTGLVNLTNNQANDYQPTWSPDGKQIAFVSERDENAEIYVMNADGSNPINISNNPGMEESFPSWAQNKIAFSSTGHSILSQDVASFDAREFGQIIGMLSILLQVGLLMGLVLLAVRRWPLPFGSLTLIFLLNAVLMITQSDDDTLRALPQALMFGGIAGLFADLLLWQLRPSLQRLWAYRVFAFTAPLALYGVYFAMLQLSKGISWTVHLWTGALVLTGVVGFLLSYTVLH
ncbi:PD40 domain-containing protein [Candidatus Acetothermia bacterium]|nr:PD40 domain-containing protein [Candidatus Acetothermia bacterium]